MNPIPYADLKVGGELLRRAMLNYDRLETEEYRYPNVFREDGYSWPGDWEGRTILALTMLAQATRREPVYLEEIVRRLPERLNAKGYLGTVHTDGTADEQQLSGHSWLLRGMVEYHLWKGDELSLRIVQDIARNLLLPTRGRYAQYPVQPDDRQCAGEAIGSLFGGKVGDWLLSTDVGCAFIMLDGASHAYQLLRWPELGALLDEMIGKFRTIDLKGLRFQTHATLSALRGILRHYETTGDGTLLAVVKDAFDLYVREGMTENYANYNWFGRPEWTEPCAVVDSFLIAVGLWSHTNDAAYLELAHGIYYNGLGYGQRPNGGFGCDCCSGARDASLHPMEGLFEAYWCCTMRGGDGLARAIGFDGFADELRPVVAFPFPRDGAALVRLAGGMMTLNRTTAYPDEGSVRLEVAASDIDSPVTIRLYVPSWVQPGEAILLADGRQAENVSYTDGFADWTGIPRTGLVLQLSFPVGLRLGQTLNMHSLPGYRSLYHGPLLLGTEESPADIGLVHPDRLIRDTDGGLSYYTEDGSLRLKPINDLLNRSMEAAASDRRTIRFRVAEEVS